MRVLVHGLSLLVILLAWDGCQSEQETDSISTTIQVDLNEGQVLPFGELYDTIRYVPLETTNANVLGEFSDVFLFDSLWAVIDMPFGLDRRISLFSPAGHFLTSFSNPGEGPGQFLKVESLWYDNQTGHLEVLAVLAQKVLSFDLDGQWLGEQRLPASFHQFVKSGPERYWFYASNQPLQLQGQWGARCQADASRSFKANLFFLDATSCTISDFVPIRPSLTGEQMNFRCFSRPTLDGYYYFHQWFDPVVYRLDETGKAVPAFRLDFGAHQFETEDESRFAAMSDPVERMRFINQTGMEKVYRLLDVGATKTEWWAAFWCKGKGWWLGIDKRRGTYRLFHSPPSLTPNTFDLVPLPSTPLGMWKDWHIWLIPAHRLAEVLAVADRALSEAPAKARARYRRVRKILQQVDRDDNPVLVLARLKQ